MTLDRFRCREVREGAGLSQLELGERAGVPRETISKFENGRVELNPQQLAEIERVLRLAVERRLAQLEGTV